MSQFVSPEKVAVRSAFRILWQIAGFDF